jgi:tRNA-dihydrouridine synthase
MVKQAVAIPVFGNGDVFDHNDCWKMLRTAGCDGVAIGRLAIARPWVFAVWTDGFSADSTIYFESAKNLAALLSRHYDPTLSLKRFKKFALYFSANFRFGHTLHKMIRNAHDMTQVVNICCQFFKDAPEILSRPNLNLLI